MGNYNSRGEEIKACISFSRSATGSVFAWFNWRMFYFSKTLAEGCCIRLVTRSNWNIKLCVIIITVELYVIFAEDDTKREHINGK